MGGRSVLCAQIMLAVIRHGDARDQREQHTATIGKSRGTKARTARGEGKNGGLYSHSMAADLIRITRNVCLMPLLFLFTLYVNRGRPHGYYGMEPRHGEITGS